MASACDGLAEVPTRGHLHRSKMNGTPPSARPWRMSAVARCVAISAQRGSWGLGVKQPIAARSNLGGVAHRTKHEAERLQSRLVACVHTCVPLMQPPTVHMAVHVAAESSSMASF
jgi:hypothetical protein